MKLIEYRETYILDYVWLSGISHFKLFWELIFKERIDFFVYFYIPRFRYWIGFVNK